MVRISINLILEEYEFLSNAEISNKDFTIMGIYNIFEQSPMEILKY